MDMCILFSGSKTATYMTFRFIDIEYRSCLFCQCHVYLWQTFRHVFMNGLLTHAICLCLLSYRGIFLHNVCTNFNCSFFNILFQRNPLQYSFLHCMQGSYILFFQTFIAAVPVVQPAAVDDMHFSVHTSASQLP